MKRNLGWLACLLCISIIITSTFNVYAKPGVPLREKYTKQSKQNTVEHANVLEQKEDYQTYLQLYKEKRQVNNEISIKLKPKDAQSKYKIDFKNNIGQRSEKALIWDENIPYIEYEVNVTESGFYTMKIEYYPLEGSGNVIQRELSLDGKVPFEEATNIPFYRIWKDKNKPFISTAGDEIRPKQIECPKWLSKSIVDIKGMYEQPLQFYLSKGKHVLKLSFVDQPMAIGDIYINSFKEIPTYDQILKQYEEKCYKSATKSLMVQGEEAQFKSDSTLRMESDGDPIMSPPSKDYIKLNMIGGWRYRKGNQSLTWKIDVPETGLYKLAFRINQCYGDGLSSYRQIKIDGKVPFKQMEAYNFVYKDNWRTETLNDNKGNDYLFYFDKGQHELTMTVKMGPYNSVVANMTDNFFILSNIVKKIIMITGSDPDLNFDYELDKKIPNLLSEFKMLADSLDQQIDILINQSTIKPRSVINNFIVLKEMLLEMINDPYIIGRKLNDLISSQNTLTISLQDLQERPLDIDYFKLVPPSEEEQNYSSNIFQRMQVSWNNFIRSFYKDYDTISTIVQDECKKQYTTIDVWVSRGKEWAEIMKSMIDEEFTPKTGIGVNVNVLPAGQLGANGVNPLTLSIVSGRAPNVACGLGATSPVELAMRGAAIDLTQYEEFNDVKDRFLPGALTPFEYNQGLFALPETMDFTMLFYRKDIIEELGIDIPNTWDELFTSVLPILNQNGLEFCYNSVTEDINSAGAGYLPFLYQNKGEFYTDGGYYSALDSDKAYKAFVDWTKLYTVYKLPIKADFYNHFRIGDSPMGIGNYALYMKILVAAPELLGRWGIAQMPGTLREDGTIDRSVGGPPSATMVLEQAGQSKESWEFLKWWTCKEVQTEYGKELESLIGIEARWNTANIEAYGELPWNKDDLEVMKEQWKWYREQPIVLGGYFTNRHLKNAWTTVVMSDENPRDALEKAVKDINKELRNKQKEYDIVAPKRNKGELLHE